MKLLQIDVERGIFDEKTNFDKYIEPDVDYHHYIKLSKQKEVEFRKRRLDHLEQYNQKVKEIHEEEER